MVASDNKDGEKPFQKERIIAIQSIQSIAKTSAPPLIRPDDFNSPEIESIFEYLSTFELNGRTFKVRLLCKKFVKTSSADDKMHSLRLDGIVPDDQITPDGLLISLEIIGDVTELGNPDLSLSPSAESDKNIPPSTQNVNEDLTTAPGMTKVASAPDESAQSDMSYRDDGMFTAFFPNTNAGEDAWRVMAENDGTGKVLSIHADAVIKQLREKGYAVTESLAHQDGKSDDELLGELGEDVPAVGFEEYLKKHDGNEFDAAKDFFKTELNGQVIPTKIGDVHINGASWREMKRGMKSDALKARLVPFIPEILKSGTYHGRENLSHERSDAYVAFHFFDKDIVLGDFIVDSGVTVGERKDGYLAYALNHEFNSRWQKRETTPLLASGQEPEVEAVPSGISANLDSTIGQSNEEINIVILKVIDKATGKRLFELEDDVGQEGHEQDVAKETPAPVQVQEPEDLTTAQGMTKVASAPDESAQSDMSYKVAKENRDEAYAHGKKAFTDGSTRVAPGGMSIEQIKDWYRGWDVANLAEPIQGQEDLTTAATQKEADKKALAAVSSFGANMPPVQPAVDVPDQGEPESSDFGPILRQYYHDAQGAIKALTELQDGEAVAALHHPMVGDIDLVWGRKGTKEKDFEDGHGLAKIAIKHPEVLSDLQGVLSSLVKNPEKSRKGYFVLENESHNATIRLDWNRQAKTWLLTAFEKKSGFGIDTRADTVALNGKGDTARLPSKPDENVPQPASAVNPPELPYKFAQATPEALALLGDAFATGKAENAYAAATQIDRLAESDGLTVAWEAEDNLPTLDSLFPEIGSAGYLKGVIAHEGKTIMTVTLRSDGGMAFDIDERDAQYKDVGTQDEDGKELDYFSQWVYDADEAMQWAADTHAAYQSSAETEAQYAEETQKRNAYEALEKSNQQSAIDAANEFGKSKAGFCGAVKSGQESKDALVRKPAGSFTLVVDRNWSADRLPSGESSGNATFGFVMFSRQKLNKSGRGIDPAGKIGNIQVTNILPTAQACYVAGVAALVEAGGLVLDAKATVPTLMPLESDQKAAIELTGKELGDFPDTEDDATQATKPTPLSTPEVIMPVENSTPLEDPQKIADKALFQSLIDKTVVTADGEGILSASLFDPLEAAYNRWIGNAEMEALFEAAVNAYTEAELEASANL